MTPTSSHVVNYWLRNQSGDEPLTLETYVSYAYLGQDIEDLSPEELAWAAQEFETAIQQLRGEDE
jgi:hypothetical protein